MDYFDENTDFSAWSPTSDLMSQFDTPVTSDVLSGVQSQVPLVDASGYQSNPQAPYDPSQAGGLNTPNMVMNAAGTGYLSIDPTTGQVLGPMPGGPGGYSGLPGVPGGAPNAGLFGQPGGFLNALTTPQSLLGIGGGLASLIGSLASGGVTGGSQYKPTVAQQANMGIGNQWAQMGAQGQLPLQMQQASLLNAIANGQGLSQPYAKAVEQAYEPQLGSLYQQATDAGRARGFYDAPATSPAGGAILGPGLSDLQGQIAQSKLNLMTQLPGLYNTPIQNQGSFASNYLNNAQNAPINKQQTQPMGAQIGTAFGSGLQGLGQSIAQQQAQQQQAQTNSMLQALMLRGPVASMSGTGGYDFSQTY